MPNSFRKKKNLSFGSGFVKISASCSFVSINFTSQSPLLTWSFMKWWRISMCLVLECSIWFLVRFIALVLSHIKRTLLICNPKYASCCLSQRICAQQLPAAMYSASAVERATCSGRLTGIVFAHGLSLRAREPSSCSVCEYLKEVNKGAPSRPFALRRSSQLARNIKGTHPWEVVKKTVLNAWNCVTRTVLP